MIPVAQLYARDIPTLPRPDSADLLQLLWCPFDHEDEDYLPSTVLRWRVAADVDNPLSDPPQPASVDEYYLPQPCVLHPEQITEYPAAPTLPADLAEQVEQWEDQVGVDYWSELSIAPGCKVGGYPTWGVTDPFPLSCPDCGADVEPLLTVDSSEWDNKKSWQPVEDAATEHRPFPHPAEPTMLSIGRGHSLQFYRCAAVPTHHHVTNMQ